MAEEPQKPKKPAGYLEQNLIPGEEVTFRGRVHWIVLAGPAVMALLLGVAGLVMIYYGLSSKETNMGWLAVAGVAFLLLGAVIVLRAVLIRNAILFAVTNKRIILKVGLVKRRTQEILLQKVESVAVDQGFLGQMLHYGTVTVRGTGGTFEPFSHVAHALELRRQVQEQIAQIH
jgi:uncharacterized membrane protein YdbT with pleckstrin-like domain